MNKLLLASCAMLLIGVSSLKAQFAIEPTFSSANGWMTDRIGDEAAIGSPGASTYGQIWTTNPDGKLYGIGNNTDFINEAHIKILRYGGKAHDLNFYTKAQADAFIDFCRARWIEPLFQIPFLYFYHDKATISQALTPANIAIIKDMVQHLKNRGVKYYSISNESDHFYHTEPFYKNDSLPLSPLQIAEFFKPIAQAIKEVHNDAIIFGPDLAFHKDNYMSVFIGGDANGDGDLTEAIQTVPGKYYCDVYSFHTYPFPGTQTTEQVVNNPTVYFKDVLDKIRARIASSSSNPNLKIGVNEMNVNYENPANNSITGVGANSFLAGQWLAETYSVAMDRRIAGGGTGAPVATIMPWSWHESSGSGSEYDLSMLRNNVNGSDYSQIQGRSTYWHLWMLRRFTSTYYPGDYKHNSAPPPTYAKGIKTFANVEGAGFRIMVINQNSVEYNYQVNFKSSITGAPAGRISLNFAFENDPNLSGLPEAGYSGTTPLKANSTVLLTFDCHGELEDRIEYVMGDNNPHLRQAGGTDLTGPQGACAQQGGIGGTITGNRTYANQTIYVESNLTLAANAKLTFDNATVIMAPGTKITGTPMSSLEMRNTQVAGCEGRQWEGIEMMGNYNNGERVLIDNSKIYDARKPITTDKVPNVRLQRSTFANGETAMELKRSETFAISHNLVAGYITGIKTENTKAGFNSDISQNRLYDVTNAVEFNKDKHDRLNIVCNDFKYRDRAIKSRETDLKEQGTPGGSAGNRFVKDGAVQQENYIDHTGSPTKYYYGPSEASNFTNPNVMNIPMQQAQFDSECSMPATNCDPWLLAIDDNEDAGRLSMLVYPNPGTGAFTISLERPVKEDCVLSVHNALGQLVDSITIMRGATSTSFEIMSKGLYLVSIEIETEAGRVTQKVIVE